MEVPGTSVVHTIESWSSKTSPSESHGSWILCSAGPPCGIRQMVREKRWRACRRCACAIAIDQVAPVEGMTIKCLEMQACGVLPSVFTWLHQRLDLAPGVNTLSSSGRDMRTCTNGCSARRYEPGRGNLAPMDDDRCYDNQFKIRFYRYTEGE